MYFGLMFGFVGYLKYKQWKTKRRIEKIKKWNKTYMDEIK